MCLPLVPAELPASGGILKRLPEVAVLHELHEQQGLALLDTCSHEHDDVGIPELAQSSDLNNKSGLCCGVRAVHHLDSHVSDSMIQPLVDLQ